MIYRVLVIDDEKILSHSLCEGLGDLGYEAKSASSALEAIEQMADFKPHIALLDLRLGSDNGMTLLPELKKLDPDLVAFVMTAYGDVKTAVAAIKAGAHDYLHKPFEFDELDILIQKGVEHLKAMNHLSLYKDETLQRGKFMIGESELIKALLQKIDIVAPSERTTVLIQGETGTGKELVAEAVHRLSPRSGLPFVKINCGAIPQNLMESELFGFEKNAFTGANARKKGLLELADGGTVFLDEIGELPFELQSKLLRFLEDHKFKRVGGLEDLEVDVRVLAATNRDLKQAVEDKLFREDLFYRLNVFPIHIPPLRQRGEDVLLITWFFFENEAKKQQCCVPELSEAAKQCLLNYRWPGNVRELKNVVERTLLLYPNKRLEPVHLPQEISKLRHPEELNGGLFEENSKEKLRGKLLSGGYSLEEEVKCLENQCIEVALALSNQHLSKAADLLGISRFALKRKLEKD